MTFKAKQFPKKFTNRLSWLYRFSTAKNRLLPNFLVIGAQKSGTTNLFHYLSQHPQLKKAMAKEIHFFDGGVNPWVNTYKKGENWYRAHFPLNKKMNEQYKTFDVTPDYLYIQDCACRIQEILPNTKLILILRNPVYRAISQYWMNWKLGYEKYNLLEAVKNESVTLADAKEKKRYNNLKGFHFPIFDASLNQPQDPQYIYSYKDRGLYAEQIKRYLKYFSRKQLFITSYEEFYFEQPEKQWESLLNFIGVDNTFKPNGLGTINETRVQRNSTEYDQNAIVYLKKYFEAPNRELFQLIGKELPWKETGNPCS